MKKISFILPILIFLGFTNVKAQESASQSPKKEITPKKKTKYALVISFISIGHGIDGASYDKIDAFIKNNPKKPAVTINQRGREGEKMMYLELSELSKKEKKAFIEDVEKLIVNKDLVKIQRDVVVKMIPAKH